jgi:hypothetical protein
MMFSISIHLLVNVFSSPKLEKRAELVLPGSEGAWGRNSQIMYAHMNK